MDNQENNKTQENVEIINQIVKLLKGKTYMDIRGILETSLKKAEQTLRLQ